MREDIKTSCQKRLSRIEGQVRGLSKMVDEDRYCIDIITQISAVRAALRRVEEEVLRDHVAHCVEHAITSGNKADQREKIAELMAVIGRSDSNLGLSHVWQFDTDQQRPPELMLCEMISFPWPPICENLDW
jgi:DNA-binding FrmR family transcriptional regulator